MHNSLILCRCEFSLDVKGDKILGAFENYAEKSPLI
jgi:hypothetical protein